MPCIIYGISYETELRQNFSQLRAFAEEQAFWARKKIKRMKKSMTYSCQNRRLLKAQRKNEKRRKGTERVHFSSSSLALALWHERFFGWWFGVFVWFFLFGFFCDETIWAVLVDESMINCKSMDVS